MSTWPDHRPGRGARREGGVAANGLDVEDSLREHLPASLHLLGGLCYIGVHRSAPGVVEHQALGRVNLGYHSGTAANDEARQKAIVEAGAALFHQAGIESQAMANVHLARWHKLVWNVPYNGLSVLLGCGTTAMMADESSRELIQALMAEVVKALTPAVTTFRPAMPSRCLP